MNGYAIGCIRELDGVHHAVHHHVLGPDTALCGAGRITLQLLGDFDPGDAYACTRCATRIVEQSGELAPAAQRLDAEFPDVPADVISSMLADSYRTVVSATGRPLVKRAEDLTRLRLEVRTRHPAHRHPST